MTKISYITSNVDVLGGELVIVGTRIPVERIGELIKHGYTEDNIKEEYPQLSEETVRGALYELISYGRERIAEMYNDPHAAHA